MTHEKIIERGNGEVLKILVSVHYGTGWQIIVQKKIYNEFRVVANNNVTPNEIESAQMELWNSLKPVR